MFGRIIMFGLKYIEGVQLSQQSLWLKGKTDTTTIGVKGRFHGKVNHVFANHLLTASPTSIRFQLSSSWTSSISSI